MFLNLIWPWTCQGHFGVIHAVHFPKLGRHNSKTAHRRVDKNVGFVPACSMHIYFQRSLTMSAEFIKSKFVRRPSVCPSVHVAIICKPNARISFKFWLLLWALRSDVFFKCGHILRIFFVFVNMGPHGSETFETPLLLQITAESFQTVVG